MSNEPSRRGLDRLLFLAAPRQPDFDEVGRRADEEERVVGRVHALEEPQDDLDQRDREGDGALAQSSCGRSSSGP